MVGQKHPATTYTFAWSPALVLIFAQSYQTVFVFIVFKTEREKEKRNKDRLGAKWFCKWWVYSTFSLAWALSWIPLWSPEAWEHWVQQLRTL